MSHLNPNTLQLTIFPRGKFRYGNSPRKLLTFYFTSNQIIKFKVFGLRAECANPCCL